MVKNLPANAGDARNVGWIPGPGRSPGEGNGKPLQYSCLENSMDRGAWQAAVHGVLKSWIQLSDTYMLIPNSQFIHSCLSPLVTISLFLWYIFLNCHAMKYCIFTWTQTIFLRLQASHGLQSFSLFVSKIKDYPTVHKQSRLSF